MSEKTICDHVDRGAVHPTVKAGGGIARRCEREALPGMLVCEEHATPGAVKMVMQRLEDENTRLREVVARVREWATLTCEIEAADKIFAILPPNVGLEKASERRLQCYQVCDDHHADLEDRDALADYLRDAEWDAAADRYFAEKG